MARTLRLALFAALVALLSSSALADHRLCYERNGVHYDVRVTALETTLDRWNVFAFPPIFLERTTYATLPTHTTPATPWTDGVAFAAAMQTHHVWPNTEPNTEVFWSSFFGFPLWSFTKTAGSPPHTLNFHIFNCRALPAPVPRLNVRLCHLPTIVNPTTYFDVRTGPAGTEMHRWNLGVIPFAYLGKEEFAQLHEPVPQNAPFSDGVQFAATMQTRNAWVNTAPNTEAHWDVFFLGGSVIWTFHTTWNNNPFVLIFSSLVCLPFVNPPLSPPGPAPAPTPSTYRVCLTRLGTFYDIRTGPAGTTYDRFQTSPLTLIDHNTFAPLNPSSGPAVNWGEGVQFAATMQSRLVWLNAEPNTEAYWFTVGSDLRWRFHTVISGVPTIFEFRNSFC